MKIEVLITNATASPLPEQKVNTCEQFWTFSRHIQAAFVVGRGGTTLYDLEISS